jgi:hypothetical protein
LTRIDDRVDLNLFEFDYDLTFMVFFLNAEEQVYARYGGRDADNPDGRQSLAGLRYTMQSVLQMHKGPEKEFAPKSQETPRVQRQTFDQRGLGRCMHCHQVKEALNADLQKLGKWSKEMVWRYPLPENVGLDLEVDRGNVVKDARVGSPAAVAGLRTGDQLRQVNRVPIHSFADVQLALDRAPPIGSIDVLWEREGAVQQGRFQLTNGWRKTDISWRASMQNFVPSARLYGADLTPDEKKALELPATRLAFRQKYPLSPLAKAAGIREGDVILGFDDKTLDTDLAGFQAFLRSKYIVGDRITVAYLRDGKRHTASMALVR